MTINICEIFFSLQGESTYVGLPCVFIRLSGCNLNCSYCDTLYAKSESIPMGMDEILEKIKAYDCSLVEVTGGEPLLQPGTKTLIQKLIDKKYKVLLETNGSISIEKLPKECIKIIDIKCPSSGESHNNLISNLKFMSDRDELKFVMGTQKDYDFAKQFIKENAVKSSPDKIHFSPVFDTIEPAALAEWILNDGLGVRLSLQMHKIIWDKDKRGV